MHCCETGKAAPVQDGDVFIDPVCGMTVDGADTGLSVDYRGRSYHFCADGCLEAFRRHPERFLDPKGVRSQRKKGIWGRYLDRLNRATGGSAPSCH